jgi:hypothetical protein
MTPHFGDSGRHAYCTMLTSWESDSARALSIRLGTGWTVTGAPAGARRGATRLAGRPGS